MSQPSMRRLAPQRPSRVPLLAAALAAAALAGAAFIPTVAMPAQVVGTELAVASRACPALGSGAALGVASSAAGVTRSTVGAPAESTPMAPGEVATLTDSPVRLSAPVNVPFWGVASVSAGAGPDQGVALAPCRTPRAEQWIPGVRSTAAARSDLVLVNLDVVAADVNVAVFGPDGPLSAAGARGLEVPGQGSRSVPLGPIVDSRSAVTLQVTSSSGRVAAYVRQRTFTGIEPLGADWISTAAEPAASVVIPVVPGGSGDRTLIIGNPDERTAQVRVQALGKEGAFAMVGVDSVDVPAQSTREFKMDAALSGQVAGLLLTSSRPITAAVEARTKTDWATVGGAETVGAGVQATLGLPKGARLGVALANPTAQAIHAEVKVVDASGKELAAQSIDLAPTSAVQVDAGTPSTAVVSVTSSDPALRVGLQTSGKVSSIDSLGLVNLADAATSAPTITMSRDPMLGT